ncbi:MAG: VOC family protein [Zoogloeaceae bacterium]|nr:VOC family protein [Zoogloeaceae bacterium]
MKVLALGASDGARAHHFYGDTLGLAPAYEGSQCVGFDLGGVILMIKDDGSLAPTPQLNPRVTLEVASARQTEAQLRDKGVTIADPVQLYDGAFLVGSFLDSEGNKLWFCSADDGI